MRIQRSIDVRAATRQGVRMKYLSFPWEQLGNALRKLSLSCAVGNAAAWLLFLAVGLSPVVFLLLLFWKKRGVREDWLLPLLTVVLLAGLWFFINPTYLEYRLFPTGIGEMGKPAFALTIDSVLAAWLLLRFLGRYEKLERVRLLRCLQALLGVYILLSGAALLIQGGSGFLAECAALKSGNTAVRPEDLSMSYVFLFLQTVCADLPEALELTLWAEVTGLLRSCEEDAFSEKSLRKVELLKRLSACFLAVLLFSNLGVNLLQLVLAKRIHSSHYALILPVQEIIVLLGILILSRFYLESRRLKSDNELFI